ncbi:ABC transporter ATP-binding protein [Leucobacter sp. M11]|uniref:ABC transporter ATP-binding protein n=1 Tax=Leucobacter sp. M11 TaxID=2993565 RepID=UPI002D80CEE0|nr:ATP-binding cassette domain-containing protein [Leucobacter sp. M11]MEB4616001.1 ATP-binding cassette domain-containing protein [Leucobacter sp. M11]
MSSEASGTAILVSDVSLAYPAHGGGREFQAVEGVSFDVPSGGVTAILGESGSGKSTLARYLAARATEVAHRSAHIHLNGGEATVLGESLRRLGRRKRSRLTAHIGYLGQDDGATLPSDLNVGDILFEPIAERVKRFDREAMGERIAEMMDLLALPLTMLQRYPFELSKGQRQRVAVLRSLMLTPRMVVADEPTLGVDAVNRPKIVELLKWYREKQGATLLLVTHDIAMLEALVDELLVMQQSAMVGRGTIDEVFSGSDHRYVQQLAEALRTNAYDEIATE